MKNILQRITDSFNSQGLMSTLGAEIVSIDDGEVQIELPFSTKLSQQHGYLHAGAITSIADSACGYAALTKAPADYEVVTAEFKINFMRPAIGERFIDRKSTRLNSSHSQISYAVFCLKKKN